MAKINIQAKLMQVGAVGAGAVAAVAVNKVDFVKKQTALIRGLAKIAIGVLAPTFLAKGKSAGMISNIGDGFIAVGSVELANATIFKGAVPVISGDGLSVMSGDNGLSVMSGGDMSVLTGYGGQQEAEMFAAGAYN